MRDIKKSSNGRASYLHNDLKVKWSAIEERTENRQNEKVVKTMSSDISNEGSKNIKKNSSRVATKPLTIPRPKTETFHPYRVNSFANFQEKAI